jgi:hypothetical protein
MVIDRCSRLDARNYTAVIADHEVSFAIAFHPDTGEAFEVAFTERGKIGQGIDLLLHDLSIALSRALQGRDPQTGAHFPEEIPVDDGSTSTCERAVLADVSSQTRPTVGLITTVQPSVFLPDPKGV